MGFEPGGDFEASGPSVELGDVLLDLAMGRADGPRHNEEGKAELKGVDGLGFVVGRGEEEGHLITNDELH